MKRHPALVSLSRDHHHALVIAFALRHATAPTADEVARSFLAHWEAEERLHFRLEEEVLLPAFAAHGDPSHPAIVRVLVDHVLIRRDAARLADTPSLEVLHELGNRLAMHVKHEEHELFPLIERAVPEPDLITLGVQLSSPSRS